MCVMKVTWLLFFGSWMLPSHNSFVEPNKVLIVIDTTVGRAGPARRRATRRSRVGTPQPVPTGPVPKRSEFARLWTPAAAAGQPVVAGLVLRCGAPRAPATAGGAQSLAPTAAAKGLAALPAPHDLLTNPLRTGRQ